MKTNKWLSAVFGMVLSATATMAVVEQAEAAFGGSRASSSSVGVSRSYSRPSTPSSSSYSRPSTPSYSSGTTTNRYTPATRTYTPPSYNQPPARSYSNDSRYRQDYNRGGYGGGGGYNNNGGGGNSAMRQIGITAAGVGGGILAAEAIKSLVSSPSHPGMYTSPQNPGQYYNAQGVPQGAPTEQAAQEQRMQTEPMQQYAPAQAPQVQYVQQAPKKESGGGFFGFLWGVLGFIVHLILWLSVVGILSYGGYKLYKFLKAKYAQEKAASMFDLDAERTNLEANAQEIFYDFQKNSDNKEWLSKRTKYIDIDEASSPASTVLSYEQTQATVALEQGKLRGSVLYRATLKNTGGVEDIYQWYNFEKEAGVWKVIGVEAA